MKKKSSVMNDKQLRDASAKEGQRPAAVGRTVIGWGIATIAAFSIAYPAWYLILPHLWNWSVEAWWHWLPAFFGFMFLLLAPIAPFLAVKSLTVADSLASRHSLWWARTAFVGMVAIGLLILWPLTPHPTAWATSFWWFWGVAIVAMSIATAAARMFLAVHGVVEPPIARETYSREWRFNHDDTESPPSLGIAMSGGGIRSAAFNLGVLQALHKKGILQSVDVMSAVSGGSYAMSWYLMQPFYAEKADLKRGINFDIGRVFDEMFQNDGRFQEYLSRSPTMIDYTSMGIGAIFDATLFQPLRAIAGSTGQFNRAGIIRANYRERIQELFQGLPSADSAGRIQNKLSNAEFQELNLDHSNFSTVKPVKYRELAEFAEKHKLPFFIFNATLLVERNSRNKLWPAVFELTADDLGADSCGYRTWFDLKNWEGDEARMEHASQSSYSYWLTHLSKKRPNRWVLMANIASAISGAAVGLSYFDPKKEKAGKKKLSAWSAFAGNFDLGYLFPRKIWHREGMLYLSDGGHSENLGAYALIKRECRNIIVVDAEHEGGMPYVFTGYGKLKERLVREMELDLCVAEIDSYLKLAKGANPPVHPTAAVMTGKIKQLKPVSTDVVISVIYIKLGLNHEERDSDLFPSHIREYANENDRFPQDPTSDQTFSSEQFIAYRDLGHYVTINSEAIAELAVSMQSQSNKPG